MTSSNGVNLSNVLLAPLGAVGAFLKPRPKNLLQPDRPDEVSIRSAEERQKAAQEAQAQATAAAPIPGVKPAPFIRSNMQRVSRSEERTDSQAPEADQPQPVSTSANTDTDTE